MRSTFGHEAVAQAGGGRQERSLRRLPELDDGEVLLAIEAYHGRRKAHALVSGLAQLAPHGQRFLRSHRGRLLAGAMRG